MRKNRSKPALLATRTLNGRLRLGSLHFTDEETNLRLLTCPKPAILTDGEKKESSPFIALFPSAVHKGLEK